jgi:hypothetical protein
LAWAYKKVNVIVKEREKNFSNYFQIIVQQRKGTFFGKEVLREMCEKAVSGAKVEKGLIM